MSIALWFGAGVIGLTLVVQTLRLRSAQRQLAGALLAVQDANAAKGAAEKRIAAERQIGSEYARKIVVANERLKDAITALELREKKADGRIQEVEDAHGDDDATLDVVRGALRRRHNLDDEGKPMPERVPVDPEAWRDEPV